MPKDSDTSFTSLHETLGSPLAKYIIPPAQVVQASAEVKPLYSVSKKVTGFCWRYQHSDQTDYEYLVQLFSNNEGSKKIQAAYRCLIQPNKLQAPRLLERRPGYILYDYSQGLPQITKRLTMTLKNKTLRHQLVEYLVKINSLNTKSLPPEVSINRRFYKRRIRTGLWRQLCHKGVRQAWADWCSLKQQPVVLCHGDLHGQNILLTSKKQSETTRRPRTFKVIDWDRWGVYPLGYDLALLLIGIAPAVQALVIEDYATAMAQKKLVDYQACIRSIELIIRLTHPINAIK